MEYGKTKLIRMLANIPREGWSNQKIKDLIDSLWRDPFTNRFSGFEHAGEPWCELDWDDETCTLTITPVLPAVGSGEEGYGSGVSPNYAFYQYITKLTFHVKTEEEQANLSGPPYLFLDDYGSGVDSGSGGIDYIMEEGFYLVYFDYFDSDGEQHMTWLFDPD